MARRTARQRAASKRNLVKARSKRSRRRRAAIAIVGGIGGTAAGLAVRKAYRRNKQTRFIKGGMKVSGTPDAYGFTKMTDRETDTLFGHRPGTHAKRNKKAARKARRG